jgi:tRNA(fMet)-specific endonuclease VapC
MMVFDTDVCIELLRGNIKIIEHRQKQPDAVAITFMTVGELYYGAYKSNNYDKNRLLIEQFSLSVHIIHSTYQIMREFGRLKSLLAGQGFGLADADLLIAATALVHQGRLITGNLKYFERIPELVIENWLR